MSTNTVHTFSIRTMKKSGYYINRFARFSRYTHSVIANFKGEMYSLPFNMYTFNKMWDVRTPKEARAMIEKQRQEITGEPKNLEEQADFSGRTRCL